MIIFFVCFRCLLRMGILTAWMYGLVCTALAILAQISALPVGNTTTTSSTAEITYKVANPTKHVPLSQIKGCMLYPIDPNVVSQIQSTLSDGAKMIKYHITLKGSERNFTGKHETHVYKPFYWVRSTGRQGTGLLLLPPTYDVLSLTTLEYGVETMEIALGEHPVECLSQMSHTDIEKLLRELVMNDFHNISAGEVAHMKPLDSVCNLHVLNQTGTAVFHYHCCNRGDDMNIHCQYLRSDIWLEILFVAITFLKILVILYSPRFIPGSLYRLKNIAMPYIHKFESDKVLKIKTVVTKNPAACEKFKYKFNFKLRDFEGMPNFTTKLETLDNDVPYMLTLDKLSIRAKQDRLLPEDYAPVSLLTTMYETCFKCKIRERSSVKECCETDFFRKCNCTNRIYPWYRLLQDVMKIILVILLSLPWLIRIYVYFEYEDGEMTQRKQEAKNRSLKFYFPGNYTVYLTPIHILFVIIYAILSLESVTYGVMKQKTKEKFKLVLRKCFRDMREVSKIKIIGWLVKVLIKPCTKFGGFGICAGIVLWAIGFPVLLVIFSFYMFPTVNITCRLFAHFFVFIFPKDSCLTSGICSKLSLFLKKMERNLEMESLSSLDHFDKSESMKHLNTGCKRLQQLIIIILCLISMYSVIFLITEFISFAVEVFIFTLMGLILNAGSLLTYFSLLFLLFVYANDTFGNVSQTFLAFNKTMNNVVLNLGKDKVESVIYDTEDKQINAAFRVKTERASVLETPVAIAKNPEGLPRWKVTRLLLFLSKNDQPMIPKHFFFESCKMSYYSVPGELLIAYLRAAAEFGVIILFLLFVLVVVLAFGDTYKVSATNKLLATVAGGFLPFMLRKIVFKTHTIPTVDTSSIHFNICLSELIDNYVQTWPIYDINVISAEKADVETAVAEVDQPALLDAPSTDINDIELKEMKPQPETTAATENEDLNKTATAEGSVGETDQLLPREDGNNEASVKRDNDIIDMLIDISKDDFEFKIV